MPTTHEVLTAQRATWAQCSPGWDRWHDVISDQLAPVGQAMIEALDVTDGRRHLDIASGSGEPGLSIAALTPHGRTVLTDLAPEMLAIAVRRASEEGVTSAVPVVCGADALPFADGTFDTATVRFGFQFFPDLAAAALALHRALAPGGRACASVWSSPEQNPWTSVVLDAVKTEIPQPPPDPDAPTMYRCSAPGLISALLTSAGFHDVREWEVALTLTTESPEQYWQVASEHVSSAVTALAGCDEATRQRIAERVISAAAAYEHDGVVRMPGLARCIIGTR